MQFKSLFSQTANFFRKTKLQFLKTPFLKTPFLERYFWLLILLLAFLAGFLGIGRLGLWGDEAFTAETVRNNLGRILAISRADTNPPFYYFILHFWTRFFGFSEISLRFPSLIFYCLSVIASFLIAKKVLSRKFAVLATVLIISSPIMLYYAQETRNYSLTTCLFVWSFYFLIRIEEIILRHFQSFLNEEIQSELETRKNFPPREILTKNKQFKKNELEQKLEHKLEDIETQNTQKIPNNQRHISKKSNFSLQPNFQLILGNNWQNNLKLFKNLQTDKKLIWTSCGFVLLCLLGLYSQTMFVVILLSFALLLVSSFTKFGIWRYWKIWFGFWFFLGFWIILGFLPWVGVLLRQTSKLSSGFWMTFSPFNDIFQFLTESFAGFYYTKDGFWQLGLFLLIFVNLFLLFKKLFGQNIEVKLNKTLLSQNNFSNLSNEKTSSISFVKNFVWFLIISLWLICLIVSWFLSFRSPIFYIRYLSFLTPLTIILTIGGLEILLNTSPNLQKLKFLSLSIFTFSKYFLSILLIALNITWWFFNIQSQNSKNTYRETVQFLQKNQKPNQIILFPNMSSLAGVRYYSRLNNWQVSSFLLDKKRKEPVWTGTALLQNIDYWDESLQDFEYVWSVYSWENKDYNQEMSQEFKLKETFQKDNNQKIDLWQKISLDKTSSN